MFINHEYIYQTLEASKSVTPNEIDLILDRAEAYKGLTHKEVAILLQLKVC